MPSPLFSPPLRTSVYVCESCSKNARSLRSLRLAPSRDFNIAPLPPHRKDTTRTNPASLRFGNRKVFTQTRRLASLWPSRPYSTATSAPQPASSGIAPLSHRYLIAVSGSDAAKFLQGLITNNVDASRQSSFYAAFLDARGRVLWDVFIWVWPELVAEKGHWACYIEVAESEAEALKKHLKKHKLRSKVQVDDVREQARVWAAWGSASDKVNDKRILAQLLDPRAPDLHRYLANADQETITDGLDAVDTEEYHLQRYKHGIPEGPSEIPRESALPMECNIDLSTGIDFKKGCYVGQELTIRTKHTGVVRKRVLPIQLYDLSISNISLEPGTDIRQLDESGNTKKGRAAGKYIAGAGNLGLALCRLEMMTSMKVSAEGGSWKPGVEFGIETSAGVVKVMPIMHDWFVLRERNLWDKNRTRI